MEFPLATEVVNTTTNEGLKKELQQLLKIAGNVAAKTAEIIGTVFIKTSRVITVTAPTKGATIKSLLKDFKRAAADRGITDVYIDSDITGWFPKTKIGSTAGPSRLLRFVKSITHAKIIDGCKQMDAYQEYDLSDAIARATALVAAGELDEKNNTGVIIYLADRYESSPCRLGVWRGAGGRLDLYVRRVGPDREWFAGGGVLVSNENLGE